MARIIRNGKTNQYKITLSNGKDAIQCIVSVGNGRQKDDRTDSQKREAAKEKAKSLAKALLNNL